MKLVWNSACITGGLGCTKPEENSIIDEGNGRHSEAVTGSTPAAIVTRSGRKCMVRKIFGEVKLWDLTSRKVVSVQVCPWGYRPSYTFSSTPGNAFEDYFLRAKLVPIPRHAQYILLWDIKA